MTFSKRNKFEPTIKTLFIKPEKANVLLYFKPRAEKLKKLESIYVSIYSKIKNLYLYPIIKHNEIHKIVKRIEDKIKICRPPAIDSILSSIVSFSYAIRNNPDHISKKQIEATIVIIVIDTSNFPMSLVGITRGYKGNKKKDKNLDSIVPMKKINEFFINLMNELLLLNFVFIFKRHPLLTN